ncbi:MAG: hypothetical protein JWQ90_2310 [Hydrocarboniphaga sp.]|uniref:ApeI family dehydratase n=1 Tax=Hydrocarboniphaga sp. TaxID=2033016 RepID=UPI0026369A6E|nr:hypothetical protein [Hydrocarboniphaga sp.]MDB5969860.1 hypothetical protein [Hydrocarboniphaga sp.]
MSLQSPPVLRANRLDSRLDSSLDSRVELELQLSPDRDRADGPFEGHFPEHAVLPGLIQLHWVVELAQRHLQVGARFRDLVGVKFQKVIQPGQRLNLELEWNDALGELRFRYHASGDTYSSGKLRVADRAA